MGYIVQLYLLIMKLFLAGKDADSYLLKDKTASGPLVTGRVKRWHSDGVFLDIISSLPAAYILGNSWWNVAVYSLLIRLSVYDIAFNYWAGLPYTFLGSTATTDKFFSGIFGKNGAVEKSAAFFILLIAFNVAKIIFHF